VTRLTKQWQDDHAAFQQSDLAESDYVYVWADGVHPKVRLGQAHSCVLVLMGVRLDGTKELIALADGLRESAESWADLLRDCRRRGMRDPELVVGDGAMGLWKGLAEVFPAARHQRCWVHKARNVTNALPKSAQPGATKAMQEIYNAEDRTHAEKAIEAFTKTYGAKFPKAVAKITDDAEELLSRLRAGHQQPRHHPAGPADRSRGRLLVLRRIAPRPRSHPHRHRRDLRRHPRRGLPDPRRGVDRAQR
jgi:transposase-like protein